MKLIYTVLIVIILLTVTHIKIHEYNLSKYPKLEVGQEWVGNADTHEKFHAIILNIDEELVEYEYTVRDGVSAVIVVEDTIHKFRKEFSFLSDAD